MKIRSRVLAALIAVAVVSCLVGGCKKKDKETETSSEKVTESISEKESEKDTEKKQEAKAFTYKAKDGSISIKLPDDTWEVKKEDSDAWSFESAEEGVISIAHFSGDEMEGLVFPGSEEEVLSNLESAGKSKSDYAVIEYRKNELGSYEAYHTTIKCKGSDSKYAYSVAYNLVGEEDIYSVNGQVKKDDAQAMERIRDAVESLKLLQTASVETDKNKDKDKSTEKSDDSQTDSSDSSESQDTGNGQYIYDSNGNAVYVYEDGNGNWVDSNGMVYYFNADGILDNNGQSYYYSKPDTGQSDTTPQTETNSFYDNQGNLITVYKNSNGNWVDSNGIIYTFGQYGVTDNYGNYYPYNGGGNTNNPTTDPNPQPVDPVNPGNTNNPGSTNGFYDDQGNYISVYKDSNGNWVDSGGMEYTFGDDGVTDSFGNFYPY